MDRTIGIDLSRRSGLAMRRSFRSFASRARRSIGRKERYKIFLEKAKTLSVLINHRIDWEQLAVVSYAVKFV